MSGPRNSSRRPIWVDVLFKRRTGYLLNQEQKLLEAEAHAHVQGRDSLRRAALEELESSLAERVALALMMLSVVGEREDLSRVERGRLPDFRIQKR